jgi:hypothetical protein
MILPAAKAKGMHSNTLECDAERTFKALAELESKEQFSPDPLKGI